MQLELHKNKKLSQNTTLKIGGVADYLVEVVTEDDLSEALQFAAEKTTTPPLILGGGSNVLCNDEGYSGLVIINKISGYDVVEVHNDVVLVRVGAGEVFDDIIQKTIDDGFWGLENLSAIPGSIGATPIQNVGAYGVEIDSLIHEVHATHIETLEKKVFTAEDCHFKYRDSFFKTSEGNNWCVTSVTYKLSSVPAPILNYKDLLPLKTKSNLTQQAIRTHVVAVRSKKFPDWHTVGTAGSFFKNPIISKELHEQLIKKYTEFPGFALDEVSIKISLGWVLDKICGLRGYESGNVRLFENQALVLVTKQGATAEEVEAFAEEIKKIVKEKTNIEIEREVLSV